jgi:hypothetical protein
MAKLSLNDNFFKNWTSTMAYILGFVAADGCIGVSRIRKRDGAKQYYFNITSKDKFHLKNIKKTMAAQHKIYSKKSGYTGKKDYYCFQIGHQEICRDLMKLGILPHKTYDLNPMRIPDDYFPDFVRGFFDGDGTVYIYVVNGTPQIKASFESYNNFDFFSDFNRKLCHFLNIPQKNIHQQISKTGEIGYHTYFYIDDCEKLYRFMYGNSPTLYLPRKRRIFEKWRLIKRRNYVKQNYPSKVGWYLNQKCFFKGNKL